MSNGEPAAVPSLDILLLEHSQLQWEGFSHLCYSQVLDVRRITVKTQVGRKCQVTPVLFTLLAISSALSSFL